jgi:hypothetical protein
MLDAARLRSLSRSALLAPTGRDVIMFTAAVLLAVLWLYSRAVVFGAYQGRSEPIVPSAYYAYHGMAIALEHGRVGQLDLVRYRAHEALRDPRVEYPPPQPGARPEYADYYSLDVGYALLVEMGRLLFPTLPDTYLRVLGLQLLVDCAMLGVAFLVFSRWGAIFGLAAAGAYLGNAVFARLVAIPLYYFWDVPIALLLIGASASALQSPDRSRRPLLGAGLLLGVAVWVRATWWPLAAIYFAALATSRPLRRKLVLPLVLFALLAVPQVWRSSHARGHLALTTRATWHVALAGLGHYPNPYGLEPTDESVFRLTAERYGIVYRTEDYGPHDQAAKVAYLAIVEQHPWFVFGSFVRRLWESASGTTSESAVAYPGLPNPLHRALALVGFLVMHRSGGVRRQLAWIAGGWFVTYVVITSLFYLVTLAYDNVTQVCLLLLSVGLLEKVTRLLAAE